MDWLYYFRNKLPDSTVTNPLYQLFLRPYQFDEQNNILVGEKVVQIDIICVEKALELQPTDERINEIYYKYLDNNEYYINNIEISEKVGELYEGIFVIYLKSIGITIEEMWDWVKKIFIINNYPQQSFKESNFDMFADTNPIMQMFSLKNVQKFEDKLGKDWWKNEDDKDNK